MARKLVFNPFTGQLDWIDESVGQYNVDKFTLNATDITNKSVILSGSPTTPSEARFTVIDGIEQDNGVDFSVSGNTISWNGLGLDGILVDGDKIIIIYN